jgi:nucleoside-diphosphate-sugar epimerase
MTIVVTGGAGFIGTHLCLALRRLAYRVIAVDTLDAAGSQQRAALLRDAGVHVLPQRAEHLESLSVPIPDRIVHLAGLVSSAGAYAETWQANVIPTLAVLRYAGMYHIPTIVASSCKVYSSDTVNAGSPMVDGKAHGWYGCSKAVGDLYAQEWLSHGVPICVHRLTTVYGPWQYGTEEGGWVSWFVRAAKTGRRITVYGDGRQARDLLWVEDYVRLMLQAIDDPATWTGVYDVGAGRMGLRCLNDVLRWLSTKSPTLQVVYRAARRHADFDVWCTDPTETRTRGWEATVTPEEGLERLWGGEA